MELLVLPAMEDENLRNLSRDELPQSAAGKTIMTTEPKFIPKEAASINLADGIEAKVRVIDCVGFMVTQAAEIVTRKVINDHSTIGIVVTTDGTIGEIKRPGYIAAEKQTIDELKKLGKPFVVLLNSTKPYSDETARLAREMSESYGVSVLPVNCEQLKKEDVFHILERVLKVFPVTEMDFHIPKWLEILPSTHWLKAQVIQAARNVIQKVTHMKDVSGELEQQHTDTIRSMNVKNMQMADGWVSRWIWTTATITRFSATMWDCPLKESTSSCRP